MKMTPEQEAAYALDFGVSRDDLKSDVSASMTGSWRSAAGRICILGQTPSSRHSAFRCAGRK